MIFSPTKYDSEIKWTKFLCSIQYTLLIHYERTNKVSLDLHESIARTSRMNGLSPFFRQANEHTVQ